MFSPLTRKRLRSFRRNRRAWWSLLAFGAIFVFCLCADWVCPCDPQAVVDRKTLEKYRESVVERSYEVKTARFSVDAKGRIFDYEGPAETLDLLKKLGPLGSLGSLESLVTLSTLRPIKHQAVNIASLKTLLTLRTRAAFPAPVRPAVSASRSRRSWAPNSCRALS